MNVFGPLLAWPRNNREFLRLHLRRVGIVPRMEKLCTEGAGHPDLFKWTVKRGEGLAVPDLVSAEWGIRL